MARAKNVDRAAARRRARAARAATLAQDTSPEPEEDVTYAGDAVPRRSFLQMPNVREDIRALPEMFRTRRLLWAPFIVLIVAFIFVSLGGLGYLPEAIRPAVPFVFQVVLVPQALLPFFFGGFLAPRASYLVGFLLGVLDAVLLTIWVVFIPPLAGIGMDAAAAAITIDTLVVLWISAILIGTLAAAFAAWYRTFLRSSQERARANRMAREARLRAERKGAERAARRPAPTKRSTP